MAGDRGGIDDYDDAMTERLLGIAADVLRSFGSAFGGRHLAIVGGAVPSLVVPSPPPEVDRHAGTADLDFHLSLHLLDGETDHARRDPSRLARLRRLHRPYNAAPLREAVYRSWGCGLGESPVRLAIPAFDQDV